MGSTRALPLVAVGGIVGALLRWVILDLTQTADLKSFSLLVINMLGAAIVGWVAGKGFDPNSEYAHPEAEGSSTWPLVAIGFSGGLTSFAAFTLDIATRLQDGDLANAATLTVLSVVLITALAGFMWRKAWAKDRGAAQ